MNQTFYKPKKLMKIRFLTIGAVLALVLVVSLLSSFLGPNGDSDLASLGSEPAYNNSTEGSASKGFVSDEAARTSDPSSPTASPTTLKRKLITAGSLEVKTKSPLKEAEKFAQWAETHGGVIYNQNDNNGSPVAFEDEYYESSTIEVGVKDISVALKYFSKKDSFEIISKNISRDDVTEQYADIEARIKALQASIKRLESFIDDAQTQSDLFAAESALTQRQSELDSLIAQQRTLSNQIGYDTLTVTFTSTDKVTSPKKTGNVFKDGLISGWNALIDLVSAVTFFLAILISWLPLIIPIGLLGLLLLRKRKKNLSKGIRVDLNSHKPIDGEID
jgi:hypothetical protein